MAGDWIKMRGNLWDDPRVARLCDLTDQSEASVVGALYWLWATADQHTEDGVMPGLTLRQIDRKTGIQGIGQALCDVGWLADHPGGVQIVKFQEHNGSSAKRRASEAQRKANDRKPSASHADKTRTNDGQSATDCGAREEKRREEISPSLRSGARATRKCPESFEVTDEMRTWAVEEAPGVDLRTETAKFRDHTFKNAITDWLGAWRNWMRRAVSDVKRSPAGGETAYQRSSRERMQQVVPRIAAQAPGQSTIIEMEVPNVIAGCLGR